MAANPADPALEIKRLQRCMNDLVSLFALPATWSGGEPSRIVHTLADALLSMLELDLVYVQLNDLGGQAPIELIRFAPPRQQVDASHEISNTIQQWLGTDPQRWPPLIQGRLAGRDISILPMRLGPQAEIGIIAVGSEQADFPRQTERLILSVAASEASIALQEAWRAGEQRRIASELDRRVAQRTMELAATNEELQREIADRNHAEEDLKSSEEKHRLLVETASDAVVSMNEDGKIQFANPATARIFGHDPAELIGQPLTVLMPQFLRELHERGFNRYLETGRRHINWQGTELTALRKNGQEFPVELSFGELTRAGHKIFTGYIRDISERKQAEDKLRASERSLRELTETIPQMLWSAEEDGAVNYCNQRTLDYTGMSAEEVRGSGWLAAVHPDDVDKVTHTWLGSVRSGEAFQCEFRFRRAQESYRWCISDAVPLRDLEGKVIRWFGTIVDLHDWREAQRALHAIQTRQVAVRADVSVAFGQNENLDAILHECAESMVRHLDAVFARIWTLDRDGRMLELRASAGLYTHLNGAHSRIPVGQFKIGTIALEQKHVLSNDIINDPRISDRAWAANEGMSSFAGYPLMVGTRTLGVMAMFSRKPLAMGTAEALASVADLIANGIERKHAEDELRASEIRLSRATRTATVGEFAASIAHEINQPLAAVVANGHACLRWLSAGPQGMAKAQEAAERIIRDGKEAAEVVRRIRALFKKASIEKTNLELNMVIADVLRLLNSETVKRRVSVETDLADDLPTIKGDRVQLQQLTFNLVMNGIEAMDPVLDRPRKLFVRSKRHDPDMLLVEIHDSGVGMEDSEKAFEAFFTTKESGMGMGLAVCRSIVDAHHGQLWATSGAGQGTTFSFTLPVQSSAAS